MSQELGDYIRRLREESEISREELAEKTRIGLRYLEALEEGHVESLPGIVFVRGFIRTIYSELGGDPDPVLSMLEDCYPEQEAEDSDTVTGSRKVFLPLAAATFLLVVLLAGSLFFRKGDAPDGKGFPADETAGNVVPNPLVPIPGLQGAGELEVLPDLSLVIQAIDKTWVRIQTDSSDSWETTMKPGDEVRLKASERITLLIGNAGGVLFDLNGKQFGPPGSRGQVITNYVITRDNL